jgi:ferric iron reductase protein FhuF
MSIFNLCYAEKVISGKVVKVLRTEHLEEAIAPLREQIPDYGRWLQVNPPPGAEFIIATDLLDPTILQAQMSAFSQLQHTPNLKIAAAVWTKFYSVAVAALPLMLLTSYGLKLDTTPENVQIVVAEGRPAGIAFKSLSTAALYAPRCSSEKLQAAVGGRIANLDELRRQVFSELFQTHFAPHFEQLHTQFNLSKKIAWGNLGVVCHTYFELGYEKLKIAAAHADDVFLLDAPQNPVVAEGKNPLYRPVSFEYPSEPDYPASQIKRRNTCCIMYKIPEHGYCLTCPLPKPAERAERWKTYLLTK